MPVRDVSLTTELDQFISAAVESGRYQDASEVVRAALRSLDREERLYDAQLSALREAIDEGDASGTAPDGVFDRVRESLRAS